jgi:hypothetical protein
VTRKQDVPSKRLAVSTITCPVSVCKSDDAVVVFEVAIALRVAVAVAAVVGDAVAVAFAVAVAYAVTIAVAIAIAVELQSKVFRCSELPENYPSSGDDGL